MFKTFYFLGVWSFVGLLLMDRFRGVWPHLSVKIGSRLRRRAMPGYSLLSVVNLCLHLVKVSVLMELWIGVIRMFSKCSF